MTPTRTTFATALTALAVLLPASPALAEQPACDPPTGQMSGCPTVPCDESTGEFVLVYDAQGQPACSPSSEVDKGDDSGEQLPEERIGGYRCPDPEQVIVSVNPDVCAYPAPSAPVLSAPSGDVPVTVDTAPHWTPTAPGAVPAAPGAVQADYSEVPFVAPYWAV